MAHYLQDAEISEQEYLWINVLVESIRLVNNNALVKNKAILEKVVSITYNSLIYDHNLNYQAIEEKIRRYEGKGLLVWKDRGIEYFPLTFDEIKKMNKEQLVLNFSFGFFYRILLREKEVSFEYLINILSCLSYEYRQMIMKNEMTDQETILISDKDKEMMNKETWKDLYYDFDYVYEVLRENRAIYATIQETYFTVLENLLKKIHY